VKIYTTDLLASIPTNGDKDVFFRRRLSAIVNGATLVTGGVSLYVYV